MPSISVVIPMHNEEENVRRVVRAVQESLAEVAGDHEIILVDDASADRTGVIAQELAGKDVRIRVLRNERNRKLGGTLRAGFATATKDLVLYTDADMPVDLRVLSRAVRLLETYEADVLCAYRFSRSGEGFRRALYARVYSLLIRVLFGLPVRDVNFAFKLFRRSLLDRFVLRSEGSFIDAELLLRARKAGADLLQIGLDYFPRTRGVSTLSSPGVILTILREMAALRRELR